MPGGVVKFDFLDRLDDAEFEAVEQFFAESSSANFMHRPEWKFLSGPSKLQSHQQFIISDKNNEIISAGLVRLTKIMAGRYFASLLRGPVTRRPEDLSIVLPELETHLSQRGVITLTINPHWIGDQCVIASEHIEKAGYKRVAAKMQTWATATAWLDLKRPIEDIYMGLSKRRRSEVRKSEKSQIRVRPVESTSDLDRLNEILAAMAAETNMEIDGQHDFKAHYDFLSKNPDRGFVLVAWVGDQILGGHVTYFENKRAYAYLLATSPAFRKLPRSTLLFWESIKRSHELGFDVYDLAGFPESALDKKIEGNSGRGAFKAGFGPETARLTPMYEKPLKPIQHVLFGKGRQVYRQSSLRKHLKPVLLGKHR